MRKWDESAKDTNIEVELSVFSSWESSEAELSVWCAGDGQSEVQGDHQEDYPLTPERTERTERTDIS